MEYAIQHLRNPATTPERIAGAARDLRDPARGTTPIAAIAAIARSWGFSDPAHFSRRFRDAYSMSPRSWRHDLPG